MADPSVTGRAGGGEPGVQVDVVASVGFHDLYERGGPGRSVRAGRSR